MSKTILIIDDNEDIRYTLQEICLFADLKPLLGSNGKEGIQLFLTHNPDLILVDFHMPEMDGLVTVRTIRQMDQYTPIIVLTVDERQQIADTFLDAGANDFALKPIKAPDIISRIKVHLKLADLKMDSNQDIDKQELDFTEILKPDLGNAHLTKALDFVVSKGISKNTLYLIADYLLTQSELQTIEQVSTGTGISYPTVHRYLNHLVEEKVVKVEIDYGKVGRPKNKYSWNQTYLSNTNNFKLQKLHVENKR